VDKVTRAAVEALKKQRHKYAFDANMYKLGVVTHYTEQCAKKYAELTVAIEKLEKPGPQQGSLPGFPKRG